jgi:hypothetical protein
MAIQQTPPDCNDVARMVEYISQRQTALEDRIPPLIEHSVKACLSGQFPSVEEREWVRGAIKAQAQRAAFRAAVIEKTFVGLVLLAATSFAYAVWEYVRIKTGWKE